SNPCEYITRPGNSGLRIKLLLPQCTFASAYFGFLLHAILQNKTWISELTKFYLDPTQTEWQACLPYAKRNTLVLYCGAKGHSTPTKSTPSLVTRSNESLPHPGTSFMRTRTVRALRKQKRLARTLRNVPRHLMALRRRIAL
ncbi:hypothetical protein Tcan_01005, partial [Toxocara canis]